MDNERLQYLEGLISHFDARLTVIEDQVRAVSELYEKIKQQQMTKEWLKDMIAWNEERLGNEEYDRETLEKTIKRLKRELLESYGEAYDNK